MHTRYVVQRFLSSEGKKKVLIRWEFDNEDEAKRLKRNKENYESNPGIRFEVIAEPRE